MSILLLVPFIAVMNWNSYSSNYLPSTISTDTTGIQHIHDGTVTEWPDSVFQSDKGTNIRYAADNDAQNLYVAMKIPDYPIQMKMMRMGMNLYIDLKGKKKENRGIEFPIKREAEGGFSEGNQQQGFDKKAMRSRYAIYLLSLKIFGFNDADPVTQALQVDGSVNLSYTWDANDVMYIEYLIPLNMLGDAASLNNKTISMGWKINGVEMSTSITSNAPTNSSRRLVSVPAGTSPGGSVYNNNSPSQAGMMDEKSFWMKYSFH